MEIQLSDHFDYRKLLRFTLPSIAMVTFISTYTIIDGWFVSNFVGKVPFAALNLIYPCLIILGALGYMGGTGGAAIVAKTLGEGQKKLANEYFSLIVYASLVLGVVASTLVWLAIPSIARFMGAQGEMYTNCLIYGRILAFSAPMVIMQNVFQSLFVAAERPKLGLASTIVAGCANILLDALFILGFGWGLAGAAWATAISQILGGVFPLIYFSRPNGSLLRLGKAQLSWSVLVQTCYNGSSEMMSGISGSVMVTLYNYQLMRLAGENGVAAYGVIGYVIFLFGAVFFGYTVGSAPLISYNFGAKNIPELQNLFRKSMILMSGTGLTLFLFVATCAQWIAQLFVGYDAELWRMATHALRVYSLLFILSGFDIFASSLFTALNNGLVSAVISFLRTLVFQSGSIIILPLILGIEGIWYSVVVAESIAFITTMIFLVRYRKVYQYY